MCVCVCGGVLSLLQVEGEEAMEGEICEVGTGKRDYTQDVKGIKI